LCFCLCCLLGFCFDLLFCFDFLLRLKIFVYFPLYFFVECLFSSHVAKLSSFDPSRFLQVWRIGAKITLVWESSACLINKKDIDRTKQLKSEDQVSTKPQVLLLIFHRSMTII